MSICKAVERDIATLAAAPPVDLPERVREHLVDCPACSRRLATERLVRGMVAARAEALSPPDGFAERVAAALPARAPRRQRDAVAWWPAWGLVPTFAAAAATLFILYQASDGTTPVGLLSTESLSAGERLVLSSSAPDVDVVLAALMEGGNR